MLQYNYSIINNAHVHNPWIVRFFLHAPKNNSIQFENESSAKFLEYNYCKLTLKITYPFLSRELFTVRE